MPADKWRWMQKSFIWLRRRFPRQRDIVSKDGDAIRPIERISNGEYSRFRCNKELANYVMPGTVVRVTNARVLGSSMTGAAREHYAVAWKMKGDMPSLVPSGTSQPLTHTWKPWFVSQRR